MSSYLGRLGDIFQAVLVFLWAAVGLTESVDSAEHEFGTACKAVLDGAADGGLQIALLPVDPRKSSRIAIQSYQKTRSGQDGEQRSGYESEETHGVGV